MNRKEIKAKAKATFMANKGVCILSMIIMFAITFIATFATNLLTIAVTAMVRVTKSRGLIVAATTGTTLVGVLLVTCISLVFSLGMVAVYRKLMDGEAVTLSTLLSPITEGWFKLGIISLIKMSLLVMLGALLCYIPGIYLALRWAFVPFICSENPDMTSKEILKLSGEMTKGRKIDYIVLYLSFFGWLLLGAVTCGLSMLFTIPYLYLSMAGFYISIRENFEE